MSDFPKFPENIRQNSTILVAPLDWGLGHSTRCIPLIRHLIQRYNTKILVAADGPQKAIIQETFPGVYFIKPPDFQIKYHKNRAVTIVKMALSATRLLKLIKAENAWLSELIKRQPVDYIISDNRYGMYHPGIPSYFICHQLLVKTPFGRLADRIVQRRLYGFIAKFNACLVPDYEAEPSLAGELSHPRNLPPVPVHYIGPLSRIQPVDSSGSLQLLVILSGPEPQRTIFEAMILEQWAAEPGRSMVIVRGFPEHDNKTGAQLSIPVSNAKVYNHLPPEKLSGLIADAEIVLCRSGYSSIMDLVPLGKKCFMVPTPGQTEQEYLAAFLSSNGRIRTSNQGKFQLSEVLKGPAVNNL